jgi:hypothetical protein
MALVGGVARYAHGVAAIVPGVDLVAVDGDSRRWPESERVSRIVSRPGLPFHSGMLRGVAVDGTLGVDWIREATRVTARLGRVVVTDAPEETSAELERAGLTVMAAEGGTVVAARA